MQSILVVNSENVEKSSLYNAFDNIKNINVTTVDSVEKGFELFHERYFEILFLDRGANSVENIKKFILNNPQIIIICVFEKLDETLRDQAIGAGIKDCMRNTTDSKLMTQRILNYIELSQLKKERLFHNDAVNLFDKEIYQHFLTFKLNSSVAETEFWDYFTDEYFDKYHNMQETLYVINAFATWMFLNKRECEVIKETNKDNLYLTLQPIDFMSEDIINSIIKKHGSKTEFILKHHKLSLKLETKEKAEKNSNVSKLDDTTKDILAKTHFDKISAAEFASSTAIEFIDKIEDLAELEDEIDESLISFEENQNIETTQLLSENILKYADSIALLIEFDHLVFALTTLAKAIENIKQEQITPKDIKKFVTLSLHLLHDLSSWRKNIFIDQDANDIHYLDSSLLSSCLQIEGIFEKEKIEEDEDDFELF